MLNSLMSDPGLVLLILFIFMLVCRVPIAISLGLSAAIVSWLFDMGIRHAALQLLCRRR